MNSRQGFIIARTMAALAALTFALVVTQGCGGGDHADDGHGHDEGGHGDHGDHGESADFVEPQSYAEACSVIHVRLEEIDNLLKSGKLDHVAEEAAVIRNVANRMAKLASKRGSGVPRKGIKEVNLTAKKLAAKFDAIHEAGDSGDAAGTRKVYGEMVAFFEILEKYAGPDDHDH